MRLILFAFSIVLACGALDALGGEPPPLIEEAVIVLPNTSGRLDHLDVDLMRRRLFVAEFGNGSVDVIDIDNRKVVHWIAGLQDPQGVVYVPKADLLVVASGGDGTLRMFSAADFSPRGIIRIGDDADNLRPDPRDGTVIAGYGHGGLAIVDPVRAVKLKDINLPDHPEGFQLNENLAYVNVPDARQIAVVDLTLGTVTAKWPVPGLSSNFPMALGDGQTVATVFRSPPRMVRFGLAGGHVTTANDTCADADDVFFDAKRQRYYVSCGSGSIDVLQKTGGAVVQLAQIRTEWGARTSLFVPQLDRLFLAVPAGLLRSDASIRILRPASSGSDQLK